MEQKRCGWVDGTEIYRHYHDHQWGRPLHEEQILFEMLVLESFQAGLSWITILEKREAFQRAFDHFDPVVVADYGDDKVASLLENSDIIRHRGKIQAAITNASLFLEIQKEFGGFDQFIWAYVGHKPIQNHWNSKEELPVHTPLAEKISKDLKKRGFKFVGPTIVYSYMQAIGMVNDHEVDCFCYDDVKKLGE